MATPVPPPDRAADSTRPNEEEPVRAARSAPHTTSSSLEVTPAPQISLAWPVVPGYEILGELGRGGMGVVYKARQLGLNRLVALKVLGHDYLARPGALTRFCREAEAIAQLQHPHIIPIHEINTAAPTPYFSMEFAAGGNLADYWDGHPHKANEVARLVILLARAIHAAHERGIVHRDLKPANVLLTGDLPYQHPKITDFGLVRWLDEDAGLTKVGEVVGTPGYMAPEQVGAAHGPVGPRSDVYALGVLLYEGLTGGPPCRGLSSAETLQLTLSHEPLPPSHLGPQVPRDLETICLHCLNKEPERRYVSAAALADDLQRFLDGVPIQARATRAWERGWKWIQRHPGITALANLVVLVTIFSFVAVMSLWNEAEQQRARAEEERAHAVVTAQAEMQARRELQRLSGQLLQERGIALCEEGDYGTGLLWLVRSLETTPKDDQSARESLALLLGGWRARLHVPFAYFRARSDVSIVRLARQGKVIVATTQQQVYQWPVPGQSGVTLCLEHPQEILATAFSDDGTTLATGCADGFVRVWEIGKDKPRLQLKCAEGMRTLAFHPNGHLLAGGGRDQQVNVWNLTTGRTEGAPLPHAGTIRVVAFSPDGKTLITASEDNRLHWWVTATRQPRNPPSQLSGAVHVVVFTPDGRLLATGGADRVVRLWELSSGKLVRKLEEHTGPINALAFSPDGHTLVSGSDDHRAIIWDVESGTLSAKLLHQHGVDSIAFRPDGQLVATGSYDNMARLWTLTGQRVGNTLHHTGDVESIAFLPDGNSLVTGGEDGTVRVWSLSQAAFPADVYTHPKSVLALDVSPDGQTLLTGSIDTRVRLWHLPTGTCRTFDNGSVPCTVAFHPSGARFLVGDHAGKVCFWTTESLQRWGPTLQHGDLLQHAVFNHDGSRVLTGCEDKDTVVRLWDVATGTVVQSFTGHRRKVPAVALSPDGTQVVSGSWDKSAMRWSSATGEPLGGPLAHLDLVQAVRFSPDGRLLLTGGDDYNTRFWDATTGKPTGIPVRHPGKIQSVAFSPQGERFATGSKDSSVRLWETRTSKPLGPAWFQRQEVHALAFRPDGRMLFSGSWDGTVKAWRVPPPWSADSDTIRRWLQVCLGQRLDENGVLTDLDLDAWCQLFDLVKPRP